MKPSVRIKEILDNDKLGTRKGGDMEFCLRLIYAISDYLDEEYERNKPCEHEWVSLLDMKRCNKCGVIG